jgi:hypothetical protein
LVKKTAEIYAMGWVSPLYLIIKNVSAGCEIAVFARAGKGLMGV